MGWCCGDQVISDLERRRNCTDVIPLAVFILFWCGMIFIAAFAISEGEPFRLLHGTDSFGNSCGRKNPPRAWSLSGLDHSDRPFLLSMDISRPFDSVWICVASCPSSVIGGPRQLQEYALETGVEYCLYNVPLEQYTNASWFPSSSIGPCPVFPIYQSSVVLNRCIPSLLTDLGPVVMEQIFGFLNGIDSFRQISSDLVASSQVILASCILSFILSILVVFTLRFVASAVVYIILSLVTVASLVLSGVIWFSYISLRLRLENTPEYLLLVGDSRNEHALLVLGIVCSLVTLLLLLLVFCLWRSAKTVTDLLREAGRCLEALPCLLFQPLITFFFLSLLFAYWLFVLFCIISATKIEKSILKTSSPAEPSVEFVVFQWDEKNPFKYLWWLHTIGFIWTCEFFLGCQQMVIAGAVGIWYFAREKGEEVGFPICASARRTLLFHAGTVALGSFLVAAFKIPRLILYFVERFKLGKNRVARWAAKCCICCLWCFERCVRYLNHNAYAITAMEGLSFCPAAKQAFLILADEKVTVGSVKLLGGSVLFLAKCAVSAVVSVVALFLLRANEESHLFAVPLFLIAALSFIISHCFLAVYEMVLDVLFLCFYADKDFSDRTGKEMSAQPELKDFVARTARSPNDEDDFLEMEALRTRS